MRSDCFFFNKSNIIINSTSPPVYENVYLLISLIQSGAHPAAAAMTDLSYLMTECQLFKVVSLIKRWNQLLCCHSKFLNNINRK